MLYLLKQTNFESINTQWNNINWAIIDQFLIDLQKKITKATTEKNYTKVEYFQSILVTSLPACLKAIQNVTQISKFYLLSGIEKKLRLTLQQQWYIALKLQRNNQTKPLKEIFIQEWYSQIKTKSNPVFCLKDRATFILWNLTLIPILKSNDSFNQLNYSYYKTKYDTAIEIKKLFQNSNNFNYVCHMVFNQSNKQFLEQWLLKNIPINKKLLKNWLKKNILKTNLFILAQQVCGGFYADEVNEFRLNYLITLWLKSKKSNNKLISKEDYHLKTNFKSLILFESNIFYIWSNFIFNFIENNLKFNLNQFNKSLNSNYDSVNILFNPSFNFKIIRYFNNIILFTNNIETIKTIQALLYSIINNMGLTLKIENQLNLKIFDQNFKFYDWYFFKYHNNKVLCLISKESIKEHKKEIKYLTKTLHIPEVLIVQLNNRIDYWTNSHFHCNKKRQICSMLNSYVYYCLFKWAQRRHGNKTRKWIFYRYWIQTNGQWIFQIKNKNTLFVLKKYKFDR